MPKTTTVAPAPIPVRPEKICDTPRHAELCRLQSYYDSTQYDGRPDWWTGGDEKVPLRERKPCIIYPLPKGAVRQAVRFCYGEGRFPQIEIDSVDNEAGADGVNPLSVSEEEAKLLSGAIKDIVDSGNLKPVVRAHLANGLATGTGVAVVSLRRGRFVVELPHAKDCWAKFRNDDPTDEVEHLVWVYKFDKLIDDPYRGPVMVPHWFRRDVTASEFVAFEDVKVGPGKPPEWRVASVVKHGFGTCPVVWTRNMTDSPSAADLDGHSLYADLEDEFDALNFSLSQRHRGIYYLGIPQPWETGVRDDDGPMAATRTAGPPGFSKKGPGTQALGQVAEPARRMSPDEIWSYESPDVKLGLLETNGRAFDVASLHVNDVRGRILETMSVVIVNAADIASKEVGGQKEMSAKFLQLVYAPLLGLVDEIREHWWPYGLQRILHICLRILMARGGKGVLIPNAEAVAKLLKRFLVSVADESGALTETWMPPKMTPVWGEYFPPGNDEISASVNTAVTAAGTLITKKTAASYIAPYFGVSNVDQEVEALVAEADADAEKAMARMQASKPGEAPAPEQREESK